MVSNPNFLGGEGEGEKSTPTWSKNPGRMKGRAGELGTPYTRKDEPDSSRPDT